MTNFTGVRPLCGTDDFTVEKKEAVVYTLEQCSFPGCPQQILAPKDTPEKDRQCSNICWFRAQEQTNRAEEQRRALGIQQ